MSFWRKLLGLGPKKPSVTEFLAGREALLSTPEHFRAFAPDPNANYSDPRGTRRQHRGLHSHS